MSQLRKADQQLDDLAAMAVVHSGQQILTGR